MTEDMKSYSVRMRERGQITIPRAVREQLKTDYGDILTLLQVNDLIILTPYQSRLEALAEKFTAEMEKAGVSMADLLESLAEERKAKGA